MMEKRSRSCRKEIFGSWELKFLSSHTARVGVSGSHRVQLTRACLQVWQERKRGGRLGGGECSPLACLELDI